MQLSSGYSKGQLEKKLGLQYLGDYEGFVVVVALDEGCVDVGRVGLHPVGGQDHSVPVERYDRLALVLEPVFFVGA